MTMEGIAHLTNEELVAQLQTRSDLTDIEQELLDRLIRTMEAMADLERDYPACHPTGTPLAAEPAAEVPA